MRRPHARTKRCLGCGATRDHVVVPGELALRVAAEAEKKRPPGRKAASSVADDAHFGDALGA